MNLMFLSSFLNELINAICVIGSEPLFWILTVLFILLFILTEKIVKFIAYSIVFLAYLLDFIFKIFIDVFKFYRWFLISLFRGFKNNSWEVDSMDE